MANLKCGTHILIKGTPGFSSDEYATIGQWRRDIQGERSAVPGYHLVRFEDGGRLLMHESHFEVVQ